MPWKKFAWSMDCSEEITEKLKTDTCNTGILRSSRPETFLRKNLLKICNKFAGEHSCRSVISITLRHGCSPVNLQHIFRTPFSKNTYGWLLLHIKNPAKHLRWSILQK